MVMVRKLTLDVKDQTDQALKQLLSALEVLYFKDCNHFFCDEVKAVQQHIVWTVDNDFRKT